MKLDLAFIHKTNKITDDGFKRLIHGIQYLENLQNIQLNFK